MGVDPSTWTLRGLLRAYEFKNKQAWRHTSLICAVIEAHAGMGSKRTVSQSKYDLSTPRGSGTGMRLTEDRVEAAATMFCGKDAPEYIIDKHTRKMTRIE